MVIVLLIITVDHTMGFIQTAMGSTGHPMAIGLHTHTLPRLQDLCLVMCLNTPRTNRPCQTTPLVIFPCVVRPMDVASLTLIYQGGILALEGGAQHHQLTGDIVEARSEVVVAEHVPLRLSEVFCETYLVCQYVICSCISKFVISCTLWKHLLLMLLLRRFESLAE